MHPFGQLMQEDISSSKSYDSLGRFEKGKSKGKLTRTDSLSWNDKSWVVGIQLDDESKAYDWNDLKKKRIINDKIGDVPIVLVLSDDSQSFAVFQRPQERMIFSVKNDTLRTKNSLYDFSGKLLLTDSVAIPALKRINAYQEFWHSWKTFHPETRR
jgi:hypothetical protein